jgi:putative transposase
MKLVDRATILIHIIFSTKNQEPLIDKKIEPLLYACIEGVLWDPLYSPALKTGGGEEHVHILYAHSRILSVDSVVQIVKKRSAEWMRTLGDKYKDFDWQEGYGGFSISRSAAADLSKYIASQRKYHRSTSYKDEFRGIVAEHGLEFDESDGWD